MLLHSIIPSWVNGFPESLNLDITRLYSTDSEILETRLSKPEFARRPVVIFVHDQLNKVIPDQAAFNILQIALLTLFFFVLTTFFSSCVALFLAISFPIVFAYMGSVHTYDDILQYTLVTIAVAMMFRKRFVLCWLSVFMGCLVRETTLLLIPMVAWYQYSQLRVFRWRAILTAGIVGIMAMTFLYMFSSRESLEFNMSSRYTGWTTNFRDYSRISESLVLPILVMGWSIALLFVHREELKIKYPVWYRLILPFIILNVLLVWVAAISREARLYFLPVLVMLPLIAPYIKEDVLEVWRSLVSGRKSAFLSLILSVLIAFLVYQPTVGGTGVMFRLYAVGYFTALSLFVYLHWKQKKVLGDVLQKKEQA